MKCFVFSIGEPTTQLCIEALEQEGLNVNLYQDGSRFSEKYRRLMSEADGDFLRVDADIIINHRLKEYLSQAKDWSCAYGWVWWQQDLAPISVMYYSKEVVDIIRKHLYDPDFDKTPRPEQYMWSLPELRGKVHKIEIPLGVKGYGIRNLAPVKKRKKDRNQAYNWWWIEKLNRL